MRLRDWWPFGEVPEIAPAALAARLAAGERLLLLDVRTAREFRTGHIAGAVHVPVQRLAAFLASPALEREVPVVAICKTAHRSIPAVRLLARRGFLAVQLEGGMDRWRRAGLPVGTGAES